MKVSSGIYALLSDKIQAAWIGTKLASGMKTIHLGSDGGRGSQERTRKAPARGRLDGSLPGGGRIS